ncbi:hypothetical protein POM88_016205 [Heracleum sosnowskyi]|uniref:Uncharacterized protein n=1 Tax=Heracleum sosnowskyi TaxID=360622 RepID=A0AAD8ILJ9_9APIA|nr:hypothetical protein POM88_016205 [Heracleum sosnowskyi]
MSLAVKWNFKDCASTLYACGFQLEEREMLSNKSNSDKNNSKDKKIKTKVPAKIDADQEFIVFQFNQDGEIDLVKDKSPPRNHSRKASNKLVFDGSSDGLEFKVREDGVMISDNEGEEKSNESSPSGVKGGGDDIEVVTATEESTEPRTLSESTRSDSSAGSFAFPVMNLEIIGSPEKMPKSNEQNKIERILRFPCCKF